MEGLPKDLTKLIVGKTKITPNKAQELEQEVNNYLHKVYKSDVNEIELISGKSAMLADLIEDTIYDQGTGKYLIFSDDVESAIKRFSMLNNTAKSVMSFMFPPATTLSNAAEKSKPKLEQKINHYLHKIFENDIDKIKSVFGENGEDKKATQNLASFIKDAIVRDSIKGDGRKSYDIDSEKIKNAIKAFKKAQKPETEHDKQSCEKLKDVLINSQESDLQAKGGRSVLFS